MVVIFTQRDVQKFFQWINSQVTKRREYLQQMQNSDTNKKTNVPEEWRKSRKKQQK